MVQGTQFARIVERVEVMAENQGRRRMMPTPTAHIRGVLNGHQASKVDLGVLEKRWWIFYAAGLYNPEEAADVTLRRWREARSGQEVPTKRR